MAENAIHAWKFGGLPLFAQGFIAFVNKRQRGAPIGLNLDVFLTGRVRPPQGFHRLMLMAKRFDEGAPKDLDAALPVHRQMGVGRRGMKAGVFNRSADGEMVNALERGVSKAKHLMH
jgi:hypothetical protein